MANSLQILITTPRENQEFPVRTDFQVKGSAVGTSGSEPHPIVAVTVRLDDDPPIDADLMPQGNMASKFSVTLRLKFSGEHKIIITATDDIDRVVKKVITVSTIGAKHCEANLPWRNYSNTQAVVPYSTCSPRSLEGLIAITREAEAAQKHVHAFGSKWAFSDCAVTSDYAINTQFLARQLNTVQQALLPDQPLKFFHVEAGITIRNLYNSLRISGLALETMGGASGQALAGAISTGTHGGDKFMAPLADSVLAIHFIGIGGTQYWIEPSVGITDPERLKSLVVPDVDPQNIIYDDATFNACLVSVGCMGVIYSAVLRVRDQYDLVETTVETTWREFQENAANYLDDTEKRFLQVILNPYTFNEENLCRVSTRHEATASEPATRPVGDTQAAVKNMIFDMALPDAIATIIHTLCADPDLSDEAKLAQIVNRILENAPQYRETLISHYWAILATRWPLGTFQGLSFSVMDIGYSDAIPASQPGYSFEMHFPAMYENGTLGFARFINAVIDTVNAATKTFFTGYISLRFTGPTRAYLGMQQWKQTCTVEISTLQDIKDLHPLLVQLYQIGIESGGFPHWGQQLDLGVQSYGNIYPNYSQWRLIYKKMSNYFAIRTFENALSQRWQLTTPSQVLFDNPVAYYTFDEVRGALTVSDLSGNANHGAVSPTGVILGITGRENWEKAVYFQSGRIVVSNSFSLNPAHITLEAWIYWLGNAGTSTQQRIVEKSRYIGGEASQYGLSILADGKIMFELQVNTADLSLASASAVAAGTYVHLAVTYDGSFMRIYFNGILDIEQTLTSSGDLSSNSTSLSIGNQIDRDRAFIGLIDEVAIYDKALSIERINAHIGFQL